MSTRKPNALPVLICLLMLAFIGASGLFFGGAARADDKAGEIFDKIFNRSTLASFSGVWDTATTNGHSTLTLQQDGDKVTGTYAPNNGKVEGKVRNGVLRLHWTEDPNGKGSARFELSNDGQSFNGTMNNTDDPDAKGFAWNGVRHAPISVSGIWNLVSGGATKYTLTLKQDGNKVIGNFTPGNGKIRDGRLSGKTLHFKWSQDGGYKGDGRFEIADDSQSFTGSFNNSEGPTKGAVISLVGVRPPVSFGGDWNVQTDSSERKGFSQYLRLQQTGDHVTGLVSDSLTFKTNAGAINNTLTGTVVGNTIRFVFFNGAGGKQSARFVMDESGKSFKGNINIGSDPEINDQYTTWHIGTLIEGVNK